MKRMPVEELRIGRVAPAVAAIVLGSLAAGGPVAASQQLAQAGAQEIKVEVESACTEGNAVFKIVNKGNDWPTVGKFSIYRTNGQQLVTQRRMRLTSNQIASFKVKATPGVETELGLYIEPEWYSRSFRYDAKVSC